MFIRIYKPQENKEVLLNVAHISKIEVQYVVKGEGNQRWPISLEEGLKNPEAERWYTVHFAGEKINLLSDPNDPVTKAIEEIYKAAVKG